MVIKKVRKDASHIQLDESSYYENRIGFWGYVNDVDSRINRVSVVADTGQELTGIPVLSKEWVTNDSNKDYVSGCRNLPPVGTRVFVLMPTHTPTGAFVLCSGYAAGEKDTHTLYAKNDTEKNKKNKIYERITQGGWNQKEYYDNGNLTLESNDKKVTIQVINKDDSENNLIKGISIKAWNFTISINENELKINSDNKPIKLDGTEIDLNGNSKSLVTYADLNSALQTLWGKIKAHTHTVATTGTAAAQSGTAAASGELATATLDISLAEAKKLKTGN